MLTRTPLDEARWSAVVDPERAADGRFVYAVRTTGVFCKPSCAARAPLRANVAFFDSPDEAAAAGFRPCKRCRPLEPRDLHAETVARACRTIEAAETPPSLAELARAANMSPHHFHRVFKAIAGVTPKAYADAHRGARVRENLARAETVTEAIYDAGFNSGGRFYAQADRVLGMTPTRFRRGGETIAIRFAIGQSSLGAVLVAATSKGVCAILMGEDPDALARDLQDRFPRAELIGADAAFEAMAAQAIGLVERPRSSHDLPLDIQGTAFQRRVWDALRQTRVGEQVPYAEVAERIGATKAARAVAGACAANPLAVAIPCHRVVRRNGDVSGYAWGVERKRALLASEAAA